MCVLCFCKKQFLVYGDLYLNKNQAYKVKVEDEKGGWGLLGPWQYFHTACVEVAQVFTLSCKFHGEVGQ